MASGGALGRLNVVLGLDSAEFTRGLSKSEYQAKRSLDTIASAAKRTASALAAMTTIKWTAGFTVFLRETVQAEKEQAQLAAILKSTGQAAGLSRQQLNEMASAMSLVSTVSAGEINQAQTTLLAFTGIAGEQFPKALQAAIDMAARTGMSVVQAAETIGRALDVPSQGLSSLSKQGFRFTADQKKLAERLEATGRTAEAQGIILDELESSYGGAARAARDTFGGSLTGLRNQLNDLMTGEDGSLDGAKNAVNTLSETLGSPETKQAFADFVALIVGATNTFATFMTTINQGDFWGWAITSGDEAKNADAEIKKLTSSLDKLKSTRQAFDDSLVPAWLNADDIAILDTQIAATEKKLQYLRRVSERNAIKVTPDPIALVDLTRPPSSGGGGNGGSKNNSKAKAPARSYVASSLDELMIRIGAAPEQLSALDIKFEDTFDKVGEFSLEAARNIQNSLGDGLYNVLTGNFDNIGKNFADMLARMAADAAAAQLASALFGNYDKSGSVGGLFGDILGAIWPGPAQGNFTGGNLSGATWNYASKLFDTGGFTGPGGKYEPAGIVHKGEYVLNQDATKRVGVSVLDRINKGYANGGLVGSTGSGLSGGMPSIIINSTINPAPGTNVAEMNASLNRRDEQLKAEIYENLRRNRWALA